ncbi:MAG TPA: MDR family MFS transporter [Candidatus Saccharimonadales bacterium]|nr:MDR family MFS transporter [Candidatus Saccharimonadales bacterium]
MSEIKSTINQNPAHSIQNDGEATHAEIMVVVVALMLAMLLAALDQTIVSTALPRIALDLNGLNKLSWVVTTYLITSAVVTPLYGKISDQLGRKKIFQSAIVIFLIGSALCGLSQNMDQLIFFRGLQGVGAGGLMALVFAVIGDIIPPRQRGRYQGYFGGVWAVASIAGPLLGGVFTDHLSWRWIFYINIPFGLLALSAIATRLHLPVHKTEHRIDFLGAGLLATSIVCILLVTVLGGATYPWLSAPIYELAAGGLLSALIFIWHEGRVPEPVIPLRLFRSDIFRVSSLLSLLSGGVMFGALVFIPEYQQVVRGYSATKSGLALLPLVGGMLVSMIFSGRLISKIGKYRVFPIIGTAVMTIGLWLFSHITLTTGRLVLSLWMVVLGLGIGAFMPVMTLAVQNSVEREDMGSATAVVTFFRSFGASLGTAIFGAVLTARLTYYLVKFLPSAVSAHISTKGLQRSTAGLHHLPSPIVHDVLEAFAHSFHDVFLWTLPFAVLTFVISLFLRETPLQSAARVQAEGGAFEGEHA